MSDVDLMNPDIPTAVKVLGLTRRSRSEAEEYLRYARADAVDRGATAAWVELFDAMVPDLLAALPEVSERTPPRRPSRGEQPAPK